MSFVKRIYDPDDPMWVIGCIDDRGAVTARHAGSGKDLMHRPEESRGTRWRWNIWAQEFVATANPAHNKLSDEEFEIVTDWLTKKGYKSEYKKPISGASSIDRTQET